MRYWPSTTSRPSTGNICTRPNIIGSSFATVRRRIVRSKGCLSNKTALAMIFKLAEDAEKSWRRLDGHNLAKVARNTSTSLFANKLLIRTAEGTIRLRAGVSCRQETGGTRVLAVHCLCVTIIMDSAMSIPATLCPYLLNSKLRRPAPQPSSRTLPGLTGSRER